MGESVKLKLAERGTCLSNGLWVRQVRQLSETGHQTAILCTDYGIDLLKIAPAMFARWCQENFFKYMKQHYNLDRLVEYGTEPLPDTTRVVNPDWRALESQIRRENGLLNRERVRFANMHLPGDLDPRQVETVEHHKAQLQEAIEQRQNKIEELKAKRKTTSRRVEMKDLPEADRFNRLCTEKKHFVDTIKLIAYRAETGMAQIARDVMSRVDDARSLMRQIYCTEADLIPDQQNKTLTVRLHPLTSQAHDIVVRHLCAELNATETNFPGTDLRLIYDLVGSA